LVIYLHYDKDDLATDCHSVLAKWRNHVSQLLNIYGVNVVRQTEIHTAELLMPQSSAFEYRDGYEKFEDI
jgi:hypothetical protein